MPASSPEEICRLFQQYMAEGSIDSVLSVYDPEAVFLNQSGEVKGGEALRQELAPLAAMKARFDFDIKQVVRSGNIALMHTGMAPRPPSGARSRSLAASRTVHGAGSSATRLPSAGGPFPETKTGDRQSCDLHCGGETQPLFQMSVADPNSNIENDDSAD